MKNYLLVIVEKSNGEVFQNDLKISEVRLLAKLAKDHYKLSVMHVSCTAKEYEMKFGT